MDSKFKAQFELHIKKFIDEFNLIPKNTKTIYIAVSGGIDSMALFSVINNLYDNIVKIQAVHINHGTRIENLQEENLVKSFCLDPIIIKAKFDQSQSNFEHLGREFRYRHFRALKTKDSILLTAHHLDDSFEWSLLSQMKLNTPKSSIGIPLINGFIRRPFLSVSKKQIRKYVKIAQIPYLEDSSNRDLSKERNYLRQIVIPKLAKRFPSYLKHYVNRSNQMAQLLSSFSKQESFSRIDHIGGILIDSREKSRYQIYQALLLAIKKLSKDTRGRVQLQLEKILSNLKQRTIKGPFAISGGVQIFILDYYLYVINQKLIKKTSLLDSQIPECLHISSLIKDKPSLFPFLIKCPDDLIHLKIKKPHFLYPNLVNKLFATNINVTYWTRLPSEWKKKVEHIDPISLEVL